MDPQECLRDLLAALSCNDRETAIDNARNLADWLAKDGFIPLCLAYVDGDALVNGSLVFVV